MGRKEEFAKTRTTYCGIDLSEDWEWWHGKKRIWLDKLKLKVSLGILVSGGESEENKYILLGALLHSVEDYYAHSYYVDIETYKENPERYIGTAVEKYHKDQQYSKEGKNKKKYTLERDMDLHKKWKDNPKKDFDYRKGKWKESSFNENKRIKGAIQES